MALDRDTFAACLQMHRNRLGLTQAEAAVLCEVSPRVWWKWEHARGDTLPVTMEGTIARLCSLTLSRVKRPAGAA